MHGKSAKWPELQADILKWVEGHCHNDFPVATRMICTRALQSAHGCHIIGFKGEEAIWCYRFMKSDGLYMRDKPELSHKIPLEYEQKILLSLVRRE